MIECYLAAELLKNRIESRGLSRDNIKLTNSGWEKFKNTDKISERFPLEHFAINMEQSIADCTEKALNYLYRKGKIEKYRDTWQHISSPKTYYRFKEQSSEPT